MQCLHLCGGFFQIDYQMIFEAILMFLDSFDTYANFQN